MMEGIFVELSILVFMAAIVCGVMRFLKQPLIIGYVITGVLASPYFFGVVQSTDAVAALAHMGISLLLFMVGISLSPAVIREVGKVSLVTGLGQILFTSLIGYAAATALGFPEVEAIYISVALTFSSTIIIMKLLSDKGDLEALYGKISIGFLIVQDIVAIFALMLIAYFSGSINFSGLGEGTLLVAALLPIGLIAMGLALPRITTSVAKSQEFLLVFSLAWCFSLSALFYLLGLSIEIGALIAGMIVSLSPYRHEMASKLRPLRDFFIIMFFVLLGSQMAFADISMYIVPIIVLSLFVLIGNPLIVIVLMGLLGYRRRTGFQAGLTVAQISEFSLILVALGVATGQIGAEILSMVTMIGVVTIAASTYLILYSHRIYPHISGMLAVFERQGAEENEFPEEKYSSILFGYNRIGYDILNSLRSAKSSFMVVDYNPDTIRQLTLQGVPSRYGDAGDIEFLGELGLAHARIVISTIYDHDTNILLARVVRERSRGAVFIAVSHSIDDALELYRSGATFVVTPHFLGGKYVADMLLQHHKSPKWFIKEGKGHARALKARKRMGHEHPVHEKL